MKQLMWLLAIALAGASSMASCSEDDNTYDPYHDWAARNAEYFAQTAAQARNAIAQAKATYGDAWEEHCDWRMYKSTTKQPGTPGALTDSVCVHIEQRGDGTEHPLWSDTVRAHYRGQLMPTQNIVNNEWRDEQKVFSQSFVGELNQATAVPAKLGVSSTVAGFSTAVQHMCTGDACTVYIPADLGYGSSGSETIPAYSTLVFFINLKAIYKAGTVVPDWK